MPLRLAINGYGRIGRCFLRALRESSVTHDLQVVAINEPANLESMAYLTRFDSTHGRFPGRVEVGGGQLIIDDRAIRISHARTPEAVDWRGIDLVGLRDAPAGVADARPVPRRPRGRARPLDQGRAIDTGVRGIDHSRVQRIQHAVHLAEVFAQAAVGAGDGAHRPTHVHAGQQQPEVGLQTVTWHALSPGTAQRKTELRFGLTLLGRLAQPR